ncbi:MAG: hypothetical protein WDN31_06540 [Hyphomicrobium sp.]
MSINIVPDPTLANPPATLPENAVLALLPPATSLACADDSAIACKGAHDDLHVIVEVEGAGRVDLQGARGRQACAGAELQRSCRDLGAAGVSIIVVEDEYAGAGLLQRASSVNDAGEGIGIAVRVYRRNDGGIDSHGVGQRETTAELQRRIAGEGHVAGAESVSVPDDQRAAVEHRAAAVVVDASEG